MKKIQMIALAILSLLTIISCGISEPTRIDVAKYGIIPDSTVDVAPLFEKLLMDVKAMDGDAATLVFQKGTYNFYPSKEIAKEYYISNHDQDNPKMTGIAIEDIKNLTLEGNGAEFIFHGRMLPMALVGTENVVIRNIAIDFDKPHIGQITIVENNTKNKEITFDIAQWMNFEFRGNSFINKGYECENQMIAAIAFENKSRHIVYRTSDIAYNGTEPEMLGERRVKVKWDNAALIPGTVLAMRSYYRPTPGIFISEAKNTRIKDVTVHYAEGMGLLAQMSEDIVLDGFNVALRGDDDPRYFTTQADATHFSGCKGKITSTNGVYEGMMDDAINVHGTYLQIYERVDSHTVKARYMHPQAWGFLWGESGDSVQFVMPKTMELVDGMNTVSKIEPIDSQSIKGAKEYLISFKNELPNEVIESCGIENLTWTPEVLFSNNIVRNNRARGALFSTPKLTIVENNIFDHTSGTAILLCGDCNGWFETGACKEVIIRDNHFKNALTNMFQFTNGVISIYPEIPDLASQTKYFHGGKKDAILIEGNTFEMFDKPILYAKSVDGLTFRGNTVTYNTEYEPFHFIQVPFYFERVKNWIIEKNTIEGGYDPTKDVISKGDL